MIDELRKAYASTIYFQLRDFSPPPDPNPFPRFGWRTRR